MENNFQKMPEKGTPEYEQMMKQYYGNDYELGYRIGFGKRFLAYFIDKFIFGLITVFILLSNNSFKAFVSKNTDMSNYFDPNLSKEYMEIMLGVTPIITFVTFLYYSTEIFFAQSLGKIITGIKIGNEDRTNANLTQLLIRYFIKNIDTILGLIVFITSLKFLTTIQSIASYVIFFGCFMVLNRKRQALHDIAAKTAVFSKHAIKEN